MSKVYEIVQERLLSMLEAGTIPWQIPWHRRGARNFENGICYRGINKLLTAGSSSPYFMTLRQVKERGGRIRDGEFKKSYLIVFWSQIKEEKEDEGAKAKYWPFLRFYSVWNLDQIEGLPKDYVSERLAKYEQNIKKLEFASVEAADNIILNMPNRPKIKTQGEQACYIPATDEILMPPEQNFKDVEGYYGTLFHELIHSTGHASRLKRPNIMNISSFYSESYSEEELTAEIGAMFLCSECLMEYKIENHVAYCQSWIKAIKRNKRQILINASQRAQKACDYITNKKSEDDIDNITNI